MEGVKTSAPILMAASHAHAQLESSTLMDSSVHVCMRHWRETTEILLIDLKWFNENKFVFEC